MDDLLRTWGCDPEVQRADCARGARHPVGHLDRILRLDDRIVVRVEGRQGRAGRGDRLSETGDVADGGLKGMTPVWQETRRTGATRP